MSNLTNGQTIIGANVSVHDAGITADANVINLNALGLLGDGLDLGVNADVNLGGLLGHCGSGVGVDLTVTADGPCIPSLSECALPEIPTECVPNLLDVC